MRKQIVVATAASSAVMEAVNHSKNGRSCVRPYGWKVCSLFLISAILYTSASFAQDYIKEPKENELIIGSVTETFSNTRSYPSNHEVYSKLLDKAKRFYPNNIDLRNVRTVQNVRRSNNRNVYSYTGSAIIIEFISHGEKEIERKESFSHFSLYYVEQGINNWEQRGEFERTIDWQERVTEENRQAKTAELFKNAEQAFIAERSKDIPVGNITLGSYFADNEVFLIYNDLHGEWLASVPINEAPDFRNNWNNLVKTPQWVISNDDIAFAGYKFENITVVEQPASMVNPVANVPTATSQEQRRTETNNQTGTTSSSGLNSQGDVAIGFSPAFNIGNMVNLFGICGKFRYQITDPLRFEGSVTYLFPKETTVWGLGFRYTGWELNLNLQSIFSNSNNFSLYGSTGLGIFGLKATETVTGLSVDEEVVVGLNTGIGFDVELSNNLFFNFEPKFTMFIEDGSLGYRFVVSAGLVIKF